jgi:hypothetical protein
MIDDPIEGEEETPALIIPEGDDADADDTEAAPAEEADDEDETEEEPAA